MSEAQIWFAKQNFFKNNIELKFNYSNKFSSILCVERKNIFGLQELRYVKCGCKVVLFHQNLKFINVGIITYNDFQVPI
jgi:hypothetical protein